MLTIWKLYFQIFCYAPLEIFFSKKDCCKSTIRAIIGIIYNILLFILLIILILIENYNAYMSNIIIGKNMKIINFLNCFLMFAMFGIALVILRFIILRNKFITLIDKLNNFSNRSFFTEKVSITNFYAMVFSMILTVFMVFFHFLSSTKLSFFERLITILLNFLKSCIINSILFLFSFTLTIIKECIESDDNLLNSLFQSNNRKDLHETLKKLHNRYKDIFNLSIELNDFFSTPLFFCFMAFFLVVLLLFIYYHK